MLIAAPASAAKFNSHGELPFKFKVASAKTIDDGGTRHTVVEIAITNGRVSIRTARLHCEAENAGGFTWNIAGDVGMLDPGEKRTVRLVADADEYSANPTKLDCYVSALDAAYF